MSKIRILVTVLVAATVGVAVAQVPQRGLTGDFGELIDDGVAEVLPLDHRTAVINGADVYVGSVWGRAIDGGTVFKGEKVKLMTTTFPKPCNLKLWAAVKEGNNGNRLQQKTVRNNGMGMLMLTVNFNGHLILTIQNRNPSVACAVATDLEVTPPPAG